MYQQTKRSYTEKQTGKSFDMYQNSDTHELKLVSKDGEECKQFYCCAFTDCSVKTSDGQIIDLKQGEFIKTDKIKLTHKRFFIQKRFSKI